MKDIPLNDLRIGMRLKSHLGTLGTLVGFDWYDRDPPTVLIVWDNGKESSWWPWGLEIEVVDTRSELEKAGDKLNLGLDQIGELAIKIRSKNPQTAIELRAILIEMFGDDIACMLPTEDLSAVIEEYKGYSGRCPIK
ncbi:MAG: hypothetical protein ACXAC5_03930 [Promethearchaeota archaeon]|jgi:hypothetical protein